MKLFVNGYGSPMHGWDWFVCGEVRNTKQRVAEYNELIYAVQTKNPDETRHQTALRYIRNAENRPSNATANGASS